MRARSLGSGLVLDRDRAGSIRFGGGSTPRSSDGWVHAAPDTVRNAIRVLSGYAYGSLFGAWWGHVVRGDAHPAVVRSARRYPTRLGLDPGLDPP